MLITADQIFCHAVGDYILQSHWMATEKTKRTFAALCHVATYWMPFLLLRPSVMALAVITVSHFFIDRFRLARFVVLSKNLLAPEKVAHDLLRTFNPATGYPEDAPDWLAVWLLIIADNILHIGINGLALKYL